MPTFEIDQEGNVVFDSNYLHTPSPVVTGPSMDLIDSSQDFATPGFSQEVNSPSGLSIRVNFSDELPLVRTKIETFLSYIHLYITKKLRDNQVVNIFFILISNQLKN